MAQDPKPDEAGSPEPKSKKKLIMIIAIVLVLVAFACLAGLCARAVLCCALEFLLRLPA